MRSDYWSEGPTNEKAVFDEHAGYLDVTHRIALKTACKMLMSDEPDEKILAYTEISARDLAQLKERHAKKQ